MFRVTSERRIYNFKPSNLHPDNPGINRIAAREIGDDSTTVIAQGKASSLRLEEFLEAAGEVGVVGVLPRQRIQKGIQSALDRPPRRRRLQPLQPQPGITQNAECLRNGKSRESAPLLPLFSHVQNHLRSHEGCKICVLATAIH